MADNSHIEWTDATWNPITGCSIVSPGCTNCYAMRLAGGRLQHHPSRVGLTQDSKAGPVWTGKVRFNEGWLTQPLEWKRPRRIFVCAHGDLFAEAVPDEWIDKVFAVMALAPWHQFQVLTKRPERMRAYFADTWRVPARERVRVMDVEIPAAPASVEDRWHRIDSAIDQLTTNKLFDQNRFWTADGSLVGRPAWPRRPLPNVWLGTSVEDQKRADERIPQLLATPAAVRFISAEPLLGPIDLDEVRFTFRPGYFGSALRWHHQPHCDRDLTYPTLDWVIVGGESGQGARPMQVEWAQSLRDQCDAADVPFFFKQWGAYRPTSDANGPYMMRVSKWEAGRLLDGVEHNGMPVTE